MHTEDLKSSGRRDVKASAAKGSPPISKSFSLPLPRASENPCSKPENPVACRQGESRASTDPALAAVVGAWPELPEAIKGGIVRWSAPPGREARRPRVSEAAILTPESSAGNSNRTPLLPVRPIL